LLRKCAEAFSLIAPKIPETRLLLVGGPRLAEVEPTWGPRVEVRAFVPDLFRHHAAVDLAIVQGGLTTPWSRPRSAPPSPTFPCVITSSSSCTWRDGSIASAPGSVSTSTPPARRPWARPCSSI